MKKKNKKQEHIDILFRALKDAQGYESMIESTNYYNRLALNDCYNTIRELRETIKELKQELEQVRS